MINLDELLDKLYLSGKVYQVPPKKRLCQVLDVACGTGVVGKEIQEAGYTLVDGLDPSRAYLEGAMDKGIFRWLKNCHCFLYGGQQQESVLQLH